VGRRKPWIVLLVCIGVYAAWQRAQLGADRGSVTKVVAGVPPWSSLPLTTGADAVEPAARPDLSGLAAGPAGIVAVGNTAADAAVWLSLDGTAFVPLDATSLEAARLAGPGRQRVEAVTVVGSGTSARFVAVGADSRVTGSAELDAAVWLSANGVTWSRAPHDRGQLGGPGDEVMTAVTPGGPGLVAVGRAGAEAAAWISTDGRRWSRVASASFSGERRRELLDVAAFPGGIVAVGRQIDAEGVEHPAVWVATDGTRWAQAPLATADGSLPVGSLQAVVVTSEQVLAVGDLADDGAVWSSPNGVDWTPVLPLADGEAVLGGEGHQSLRALAAAPTDGGVRFVAVGEDDGTAAAWWSPDGAVWHRQPVLDGGDTPAAVAALADRFLAVGPTGRVWYLRY
jgi:hypothetical protein